MSTGVLANDHRRRMAAATGGPDAEIRPLSYIAFGDGAANPDGTIKPVDKDAKGLINELARKVAVPFQDDEFSATITAQLENNELVGKSISEIAAFDDLGRVIAFRHFKPKPKENDEKMRMNIRIRY